MAATWRCKFQAAQYREGRFAASTGLIPCVWCLVPLTALGATVEHMVPLCLGGLDETANMELACDACNNERNEVVSLLHNVRRYEKFRNLKRGRKLIRRQLLRAARRAVLVEKWDRLHLLRGVPLDMSAILVAARREG